MNLEALTRWVEGGLGFIRRIVNEAGIGMRPRYFFYALRDPGTGEPFDEPTTCSCVMDDDTSRETMIRVLARAMDRSDTQGTIMIWIDRDLGHVNLFARSLSVPDLLAYVAEVSELDGVTVCGPFRAAQVHFFAGAPGLA